MRQSLHTRSLLLPVIALTWLAGMPQRAPACTCVPTSDVCTELARSDAVFLGEVVEITSADPEYPGQMWVTIRVDAAWKGAPTTTTRVLSYGGLCGFNFQAGMPYLVYANLVNQGPSSDPADVLGTSLCSRTHASAPQDPDLAQLGSGCPPMSLAVYPNPSRGFTRLSWTIPKDQASVRLDVVDA